jgi:uncharacterized protein YbjT (DUF2867 family)
MLALIAGATGFVGSRLAPALLDDGLDVRCLVRDTGSDPAGGLEALGCELVRADLAGMDEIGDAFAGVDVAYFLVHMMGRRADYAGAERRAAARFAAQARQAGVGRLVYLGGLGAGSPHLRSRHETAMTLREEGPPLTYFRAAMVVGAGSESYRTLRYLVRRLPVMIAPAWLKTDTQPIGVDDAVEYLRRAPEVSESEGREVQIGGPDVLSYGEMLDRMAIAMGKRPRLMIPVPFITPWLSALWLGLITPVDTNVARPLVEGLRTATVVTDPSGAEPFGVSPLSFDETLSRSLREDADAAPAR